MILHGETMALVPDTLQKVECLWLTGHNHRVGPTGEVHLLKPLGQSRYRFLLGQAQPVQYPDGDA